MKSFVITILDNPKSVQAAERCIKSMPDFNVEKWEAFTPSSCNVYEEFENRGFDHQGFDPQGGKVYSFKENAMAAFLSHTSIWMWCEDNNEEVQIFEHDAVATGFVPRFIGYNKCISLGKPSYGNYKIAPRIGVHPLFSKPYFPGAHAYRMKPAGAKLLLAGAKKHAQPTDIFLNNTHFPWLEEYYPWTIDANDSFTTIQRELGCRAKHNWDGGETFQIIHED